MIKEEYRLEADMCKDLTAWFESNNFEVYPEADGWDLLVVKGKIKFGIQAKLVPNMKVLTQAIKSGPQYHIVAVGRSNTNTRDFILLARALGFIVIDMSEDQDLWLRHNRVILNSRFELDWFYYRQEPGEVYVPPIKVNLPAGVPSPKNVSQWKIAVCQLERLIKRKGYVNVHDVEDIVIFNLPKKKKNYARTLMRYYCVNTGRKDPNNPKCKKFVLKPYSRPSKKFKEIYEALEKQDES